MALHPDWLRHRVQCMTTNYLTCLETTDVIKLHINRGSQITNEGTNKNSRPFLPWLLFPLCLNQPLYTDCTAAHCTDPCTLHRLQHGRLIHAAYTRTWCLVRTRHLCWWTLQWETKVKNEIKSSIFIETLKVNLFDNAQDSRNGCF